MEESVFVSTKCQKGYHAITQQTSSSQAGISSPGPSIFYPILLSADFLLCFVQANASIPNLSFL